MFVLYVAMWNQLFNLHKYTKADNRCHLVAILTFDVSDSWDEATTEVEFTRYQEPAHIFG